MNASLAAHGQRGRRVLRRGARGARHQLPVLREPERRHADAAASWPRAIPVLTFASGPTNSIRGGGFLSGLDDCIVVDIGGTTTDVGVLVGRLAARELDRGRCRRRAHQLPHAGRAVDRPGRRQSRACRPRRAPSPSVRIRSASSCAAKGWSSAARRSRRPTSPWPQAERDIGNPAAVAHLDRAVGSARSRAHARDDRRRDRSHEDLRARRAGRARRWRQHSRADQDIRGASQVIIPEQAGVANAIGAAIAQVSGEVDQVYLVRTARSRDSARAGTQRATDNARSRAGALPSSVRIADVEELPLQYLPGGAVRVRVKAVGELADAGSSHECASNCPTPAISRAAPPFSAPAAAAIPTSVVCCSSRRCSAMAPAHQCCRVDELRRRRAGRSDRRHGRADGHRRKDHRLRAKASACCVRWKRGSDARPPRS